MDIHQILMQAIDEKRHLLPEESGKALISQYGMRGPSGKRVTRSDELRSAARKLGYPLVVKAMAPDLIHKTDEKAVTWGLKNILPSEGDGRTVGLSFPGCRSLLEKMVTRVWK